MQQKTAVTTKAVVLVDAHDQVVGCAEKLHAHQHALLHRAFSILVFNQHKDLLLQQRAHSKYHCPGLWTNTCCSHAILGEAVIDTAQRRLQFEMGMQTPLTFVDTFLYKAQLGPDLWEHELDYVFIAWSDQPPAPNADEVATSRWISLPDLQAEISTQPEAFTPWLTLALPIALTHPHFQPK